MTKATRGQALLVIALATLLVLAALLVLSHHEAREAATPRHPITADRYRRILGVGLAVDWLNYRRVEHWYFYWRSHGVSIPAMIRAKGFTHVRIRISGDVVANKTLLQMLRTVINDCLGAGLVPVITYTAPRLRGGDLSSSAQRHFVQWWVTVAKYLRDESYLVSYDLLVEGSGALRDKPELLNRLYNETIAVIRRIDPYRVIIVTPANTSSPFSLKCLRTRFDNYTIAEWHIYAGGPKGPLQNPFDKAFINAAIETALNWSKETHVPVYMGAWRPNKIPKHNKERLPDGAPRGKYPLGVAIQFSKYMAEQLCSHHIPFTVNADTLFIDYEKPGWYPSQEPIINTIINTCKAIETDEEKH